MTTAAKKRIIRYVPALLLGLFALPWVVSWPQSAVWVSTVSDFEGNAITVEQERTFIGWSGRIGNNEFGRPLPRSTTLRIETPSGPIEWQSRDRETPYGVFVHQTQYHIFALDETHWDPCTPAYSAQVWTGSHWAKSSLEPSKASLFPVNLLAPQMEPHFKPYWFMRSLFKAVPAQPATPVEKLETLFLPAPCNSKYNQA